MKAADVKVWMAKHLEKMGWNVSLDKAYDGTFIDISAACAQTVGLFVTNDLADCYSRPDNSNRYERIIERVKRVRGDLKKASDHWSEIPQVETYEMYLNCLPIDIFGARLDAHAQRAGNVTGTIYAPHHNLKDGNIYVIYCRKPHSAFQPVSVFSSAGGRI